jgi:hypothetical protein
MLTEIVRNSSLRPVRAQGFETTLPIFFAVPFSTSKQDGKFLSTDE